MSAINLEAIFSLNTLGAILALSLIITNFWRLSNPTRENRVVCIVIALTIICCILEPITFVIDGASGIAARLVNYWGNLIIYLSDLCVGPLWIMLLCAHLNLQISRVHKVLVRAVFAAGALMLALNCFIPLAFSVSAENIYARGPFFMFFAGVNVLFMLDSLCIYLWGRRKGGVLKSFPVVLFLAPVAIGMGMQLLHFGTSAIWPFITVATAGVIVAMQNTIILRDALTGVYNRAYLEAIKRKVSRPRFRGSTTFGALMLDLNGFKHINDAFGHLTGDEALIRAARVLEQTSSTIGTVIRYAGDEFIVLLNVSGQDALDDFTQAIHAAFRAENETSEHPYELSVSIGSSIVDLRAQSIDDIVNTVDKLMFESKRAYYQTHDRRKRS